MTLLAYRKNAYSIKERLRVINNLKFSDVNDSNGIFRDFTNLEKWGNGDIELFANPFNDIYDPMLLLGKRFYNNEE